MKVRILDKSDGTVLVREIPPGATEEIAAAKGMHPYEILAALHAGDEIVHEQHIYQAAKYPDVLELAARFSEIVRFRTDADEMQHIVDRNLRELDPTICHSHDFLDANIAMRDAWEVGSDGAEIDMDNAKMVTILNTAWAIAKRYGFAAELAEADR